MERSADHTTAKDARMEDPAAASGSQPAGACAHSAAVEESPHQPQQAPLCEECGAAPSKYRCPGCQRRSCSLACVRAHKEASSCSGQRDRTVFIALKDFDDRSLLSDFRLLEEIGRADDVARRCRPPAAKPQLPPQLASLVYQASWRSVKLLIMPPGMAKRKANSTRYDARGRTMSWRVEWRFPAVGIECVNERVDEHSVVAEVLSAHLRHPAPYYIPLRPYAKAGLEALRVFMRKEKTPANQAAYFPIDTSKPLATQLSSRTIIEFPVFIVALPHEALNYPPPPTVAPPLLRPQPQPQPPQGAGQADGQPQQHLQQQQKQQQAQEASASPSAADLQRAAAVPSGKGGADGRVPGLPAGPGALDGGLPDAHRACGQHHRGPPPQQQQQQEPQHRHHLGQQPGAHPPLHPPGSASRPGPAHPPLHPPGSASRSGPGGPGAPLAAAGGVPYNGSASTGGAPPGGLPAPPSQRGPLPPPGSHLPVTPPPEPSQAGAAIPGQRSNGTYCPPPGAPSLQQPHSQTPPQAQLQPQTNHAHAQAQGHQRHTGPQSPPVAGPRGPQAAGSTQPKGCTNAVPADVNVDAAGTGPQPQPQPQPMVKGPRPGRAAAGGRGDGAEQGPSRKRLKVTDGEPGGTESCGPAAASAGDRGARTALGAGPAAGPAAAGTVVAPGSAALQGAGLVTTTATATAAAPAASAAGTAVASATKHPAAAAQGPAASWAAATHLATGAMNGGQVDENEIDLGDLEGEVEADARAEVDGDGYSGAGAMVAQDGQASGGSGNHAPAEVVQGSSGTTAGPGAGGQRGAAALRAQLDENEIALDDDL